MIFAFLCSVHKRKKNTFFECVKIDCFAAFMLYWIAPYRSKLQADGISWTVNYRFNAIMAAILPFTMAIDKEKMVFASLLAQKFNDICIFFAHRL